MAIRGSLAEASMADVIQLLAIGRKTGCLSVSDGGRFGRVYFDQGLISHASLLNRRDRLGDLLVRNRLVHPGELAAAVAEQGSLDGVRIGEILIEHGAVTREQVEHYLRLQIEEAVHFLLTWTRGSFHFEPDARPDEGELFVAINPESVLLEGARRVDEWAVIRKRIPSQEIVFALDRSHGDPEAEEITEDQRRLLPLIDGRRSVAELVDESGMLEFEATKALFGLVQAGYARPEGRKRGEDPDEDPSGTGDRLALAYYRSGMLEEAERELRRLLGERPDDAEARFRLGCVLLRRHEWRSAARELKRVLAASPSPGAFRNLALALEGDGRLELALATVEAGLRDDAGDRALILSRAVLLTRLGRFAEACEAFDRARAGYGTPGSAPRAYWAASVVALGGAGRSGEAVERGEEGLRFHPRDPAILTNTGAAAWRAGDGARAETLCRRALAMQPHGPQALRCLAEVAIERGRHEEAIALAHELIDQRPEDAEARFLLGRAAYGVGDRQAAAREWRRALELDPSHRAARTHLDLVEPRAAPAEREERDRS